MVMRRRVRLAALLALVLPLAAQAMGAATTGIENFNEALPALQLPEPAALALFIVGLLCVAIGRWRHHESSHDESSRARGAFEQPSVPSTSPSGTSSQGVSLRSLIDARKARARRQVSGRLNV
jgi:hypothetical protein